MSQYFECPKCKSSDWGGKITGGDLEQEYDCAYREYECECGFSWREVFVFSQNETIEDCKLLDDKGNIIEGSGEWVECK